MLSSNNAPRIGNGFVIIVSVTGGSNRCVSGDMALVHRFSSCCLLSQLLLTPPRSRSDGPFAVAASICAHYHAITDKNMINNFTSHSSLVDIQFIHQNHLVPTPNALAVAISCFRGNFAHKQTIYACIRFCMRVHSYAQLFNMKPHCTNDVIMHTRMYTSIDVDKRVHDRLARRRV